MTEFDQEDSPRKLEEGARRTDESAVLRRELKALRRDEGRTLVKLLASPAIRRALGHPPEGELLVRFDAAIADLGTDLRTGALKNAYGIGQRDPANLKTRRERFGAEPTVDRGPDTIANWEDEKIDELVARFAAGAVRPQYEHHMVAVAVRDGSVAVVAEGEATPGAPMQQRGNPDPRPFLYGFVYHLPTHLRPIRLTIAVMFMDETPASVWSAAGADLLIVSCGDGRQNLEVVPGGIRGLPEAASHAAIHWDDPTQGLYFAIAWQ